MDKISLLGCQIRKSASLLKMIYLDEHLDEISGGCQMRRRLGEEGGCCSLNNLLQMIYLDEYPDIKQMKYPDWRMPDEKEIR